MILKKYRIGPVGDLNAIYKRVKLQDTNTQDKICALCGVGPEKCKTLIVYRESVITYHNLCFKLKFTVISKYKYIPWKIR